MSVYLFVCLFICVIAKHPLLGVVEDFLSKNNKKLVRFFTRMLKQAVLDQPTVDSGGVTKGRSVTVAERFSVSCGTCQDLPAPCLSWISWL